MKRQSGGPPSCDALLSPPKSLSGTLALPRVGRHQTGTNDMWVSCHVFPPVSTPSPFQNYYNVTTEMPPQASLASLRENNCSWGSDKEQKGDEPRSCARDKGCHGGSQEEYAECWVIVLWMGIYIKAHYSLAWVCRERQLMICIIKCFRFWKKGFVLLLLFFSCVLKESVWIFQTLTNPT